ncbi:MAG: CBS domain-containing protein [Saprospiraceae bacterium]|nr:CBS domain-containing protein [Saprospiraceae bacterium]
MLAKHLITETIIPLKTSDTGITALSWMDDYKVSHLPIVNNVDFLGLISDIDIYNMNDISEAVGNHTLSLSCPFVYDHQHILEIVKVVSVRELSLIPVLDSQKKYLGSITLRKIIEGISKISAAESPGGIIVLEVSQNDYSLSEISQIIESNNAKVLSLYVSTHDNSTKMDVVIKINKIDISPILQTFNRYSYNIKASFSEKEDTEDLRERYDSLMKYLNI